MERINPELEIITTGNPDGIPNNLKGETRKIAELSDGFNDLLKGLTPPPQTSQEDKQILEFSPKSSEAPERVDKEELTRPPRDEIHEPIDRDKEAQDRSDLKRVDRESIDRERERPVESEKSRPEEDSRPERVEEDIVRETDPKQEKRTDSETGKDSPKDVSSEGEETEVPKTEESDSEAAVAPTDEKAAKDVAETQEGQEVPVESVKDTRELLQEILQQILALFQQHFQGGEATGEGVNLENVIEKIEAFLNDPAWQKIQEQLEVFKVQLLGGENQDLKTALQEFLDTLLQTDGETTPLLDTLNALFNEQGSVPGQQENVLLQLLENPQELVDNLRAILESKLQEGQLQTELQQLPPEVLQVLEKASATVPVTPEVPVENVDPNLKPRIIITPAGNEPATSPQSQGHANTEGSAYEGLQQALQNITENPQGQGNHTPVTPAADIPQVLTEAAPSTTETPQNQITAQTAEAPVKPEVQQTGVKAEINDSSLAGMEKGNQPTQVAENAKANGRFVSYLNRAFNAEPQVMERIVTQVRLQVTQTSRDIRFSLYPPDLGQVRVMIHESEGVVSAKIQVDTFVIKDIVENNLSQLKQALGENAKVDRVEVEVREDAPDKRDFNFLNQTDNQSDGRKREAGYATDAYNALLEEAENLGGSFGLDVPMPGGVKDTPGGLLSVDLIG